MSAYEQFGKETVHVDGRRLPFACRISPATAVFMARLPGTNGQKLDRLVSVVRGMSALLPDLQLK